MFKEIYELKYKNQIQPSDYNYMHHISSDKKYAWSIEDDKSVNDFKQKSILDL